MSKTQFKDFFYLFIGLTIFTGLFPSCGGGNRPSDNKYKESARYFAADESLSPVIDEELDIFHMKSKRDSIHPLYISEQEAIDKLLNQEVLLVFTTRSLTPNEENILKERQYRPRVITLAYDALALIVNKANPDTLINVDNFRKIMSEGGFRQSQVEHRALRRRLHHARHTSEDRRQRARRHDQCRGG